VSPSLVGLSVAVASPSTRETNTWVTCAVCDPVVKLCHGYVLCGHGYVLCGHGYVLCGHGYVLCDADVL
jgi:hypothetical protein